VKILHENLFNPNWRALPQQFDVPANSQVFGKLLRDAGFEAVLYPSTKGPKRCLAVFVENFENSSSKIELCDRYPSEVRTPVLSSETFLRLA
jgi:hypothetical protein